jgi:predicted MPP superfamily phosphohydrolase
LFNVNEILWSSDIHLNFFTRSADRKGDVERLAKMCDAPVLLSGDIAEGDSFPELLSLFAAEAGVPVYFVLGNHDLYGITREQAKEAAANVKGATYLGNRDEPIELTETVALVGADGWYDCRFGEYALSNLELADFRRIKDLEYLDRNMRLEVFQRWADEESSALVERVERALEAGYATVYALTHVPPVVPPGAKYEGLPYYSNFVMGAMLKVSASRFPQQFVTVLAGHTHEGGMRRLGPNIEVHISESDYNEPVLLRIPL